MNVGVPELANLQSRIDEVENSGRLPFPWFVRLTSRSPKDSSDCKAVSAKQVLKLLCESERVREDIEDYGNDQDSIGIVLQPWNTAISVTEELRLFFFKKKLVAICPIDDELNCPLSDEDIDVIIHFFDQLSFAFQNYIVDLCFYRNSKTLTIIELNPYGSLSDAMAFDWETDKAILFPEEPPARPTFRQEP